MNPRNDSPAEPAEKKSPLPGRWAVNGGFLGFGVGGMFGVFAGLTNDVFSGGRSTLGRHMVAGMVMGAIPLATVGFFGGKLFLKCDGKKKVADARNSLANFIRK